MIKIEKKFKALGTLNTIYLYGINLEKNKLLQTAEQIKERIVKIDDQLSRFKETSETTQVNKNAGKKTVKVSEDLIHLVNTAKEYSLLTDGRFDITTALLTNLWKECRKKQKIPDKTKLEQAKKLVDYRKIICLPEIKQVGLKEKGMQLDFGGIAKGYAVDIAKDILFKQGVVHAVLNFGGSVFVLGEEKVIGIQNPFEKTGIYFGKLKVKNQAVVTSGIYEQCLTINGENYHHIIDPITGYPSKTELVSVTVIGKNAEKLDAIATSILLCGMEKGSILMKNEEIDGIIIDKAGRFFISKGIQKRWINN